MGGNTVQAAHLTTMFAMAAMEPPGYGRKHRTAPGSSPPTSRCRNGAARLWAETPDYQTVISGAVTR
jgi:hypothetical protein